MLASQEAKQCVLLDLIHYIYVCICSQFLISILTVS